MKKVTDILREATKPIYSFEIIPPKRGSDGSSVKELASDLKLLGGSFINITSHSAELEIQEDEDSVKKVVNRKHLATNTLSVLVQLKNDIPAVPHGLCEGFTREETEDWLMELNIGEIKNVMAIKGDVKYKKKVENYRSLNRYASDLVEQIYKMNQGIFVRDYQDNDPSDFCIGVAGYPEKHYQSPNKQRDLMYLKKKVDAGADYIVTQMFFNNQHYFNFVKDCRDVGIDVPIIPGLKILSSPKQIVPISERFFCEIPEDLVDRLNSSKPKKEGIEWAWKQTKELVEWSRDNKELIDYQPIVHYFVMGKATHAKKVIERFREEYGLDL